MAYYKKRKADRINDVYPEESNLPTMRTEEIAAKHLGKSKKEIKEYKPEYLHDTGNAENGKEDFENLLRGMSEPEKD